MVKLFASIANCHKYVNIYRKYVQISDIASMIHSNNVSMVNLFASMINFHKYELYISQVCTDI
jgi:Flp pilus assembly protein protease CpaA